jgi:hypothetical protein
MGRFPTPFGITAGEGSVNGQAASIPRATSFQQKVNESFAVLNARRSPSLRSDTPLSRSVAADGTFILRHLLFTVFHRSLLALSEVTRRCPDLLPLAFNHSPFAVFHRSLAVAAQCLPPFAIRCFDCSLLAAQK